VADGVEGVGGRTTTGLLPELGDVRGVSGRFGTEGDRGVVDGLAEGGVPLDCISSRRALDRALKSDDEEPDRLGVVTRGAGVVGGLGTVKDLAVLGGGEADGVLGRGLGAERISCRRADELLLLGDDALGRGEAGAGRVGTWNFGVELAGGRDEEDGRGAEKDRVVPDDELPRDAEPLPDQEGLPPERDGADASGEGDPPLDRGGAA
jgi:hypothetical protein